MIINCSDNAFDVLYSDGKLLLRGKGEMYDYGTAIPISDCRYPDITGDGRVSAADASLILAAAANLGTGRESGLTPEQEQLADVNRDGKINAIDASLVLSFAADLGVGKYSSSQEGWIEFLNNQSAGEQLSPFFDDQDIKSLVVSDGIRPLAKLSIHIKITNTCKQRKPKSKTLSSAAVSF